MATPTPARDRNADETTPYVEDVASGQPTIDPPDEPTPREPREPEQLSLEEAKQNLEKADAAELED